MTKSCCGGNADALLAARRGYENTPVEKSNISTVHRTTKGRSAVPMADDNNPNAVSYVRMEYIGNRSGAVTYPGARGSGRTYRAGRNPTDRFHNVHPGDVATLEAGGEFRRTAPAIVDHVPTSAPVQTPVPVPATAPMAELVNQVAEMAAGGLEPELVIESAPVADTPANVEPPTKVIQDATAGPVVRKRGGGRKGKNSKLQDLPPLG